MRHGKTRQNTVYALQWSNELVSKPFDASGLNVLPAGLLYIPA
jgi:hypothetical protein